MDKQSSPKWSSGLPARKQETIVNKRQFVILSQNKHLDLHLFNFFLNLSGDNLFDSQSFPEVFKHAFKEILPSEYLQPSG